MSKTKMQKELFEAEATRRLEDAMPRNRPGSAVGPPDAAEGDGKGILPYLIQPVAEGSDVTGRAGLPLVVEAMRGYRMDELIRANLKLKQRQRGYSEGDVVEAVVLLQISGGEHMEDINVLREDAGLSPSVAARVAGADMVSYTAGAFQCRLPLSALALLIGPVAVKKSRRSARPTTGRQLIHRFGSGR